MIEGIPAGKGYIDIVKNGFKKKQTFTEPKLGLPGYLKFNLGWIWIGQFKIVDESADLIAVFEMDIDNLRNNNQKDGMLGDRFYA